MICPLTLCVLWTLKSYFAVHFNWIRTYTAERAGFKLEAKMELLHVTRMLIARYTHTHFMLQYSKPFCWRTNDYHVSNEGVHHWNSRKWISNPIWWFGKNPCRMNWWKNSIWVLTLKKKSMKTETCNPSTPLIQPSVYTIIVHTFLSLQKSEIHSSKWQILYVDPSTGSWVEIKSFCFNQPHAEKCGHDGGA